MKLFKKKEAKENKNKESIVKGNSFGASGFTLGILGIFFAGFWGIPLSIIGFIFCFIQQRRRPTKLGKAGLIINVFGLILSILFIIYVMPILTQYIQDNFPTA